MQAIEIERAGWILFSPVPIPDDVVTGLGETGYGRLLTGIKLEVPPERDALVAGREAPHMTLCVSKVDPKLYRVYRYPEEIDHQHFQVEGHYWSELATEVQWRDFLRFHHQMERIAGDDTGEEMPEAAFHYDDEDIDLPHVGRAS